MTLEYAALVIAGVAATISIATYFGRVSLFLTIREHDVYMHSVHKTFVDVDRRLTRIEDRLNGGEWHGTRTDAKWGAE